MPKLIIYIYIHNHFLIKHVCGHCSWLVLNLLTSLFMNTIVYEIPTY